MFNIIPVFRTISLHRTTNYTSPLPSLRQFDTTDHAYATQDTPYTATTANPEAELDIQHVHGPLYQKTSQGLHFVEPGADGINRKAARS